MRYLGKFRGESRDAKPSSKAVAVAVAVAMIRAPNLHELAALLEDLVPSRPCSCLVV
jgi:hypothetical protein